MKDSLYRALYGGKGKKKSREQEIKEMIIKEMCDHKRVGKKGNEKKNWDEVVKDGKTYAKCLNPHCRKEICLELVEPSSIQTNAKEIINVIDVIMINNEKMTQEELQLWATIKVYLQLLPETYQQVVLNRLADNGYVDEDDDDNFINQTGPAYISSNRSFGFSTKGSGKSWKKKGKKGKNKKKKNKKKKDNYEW